MGRYELDEPREDCYATDSLYPNEDVELLTIIETECSKGFYWLARRYNGEIIITNEDRLSDFYHI